MSLNLTKIPPYHYIHILDTNTNICRLLTGPVTFLCKEHEKITVKEPQKMHMIPKSNYVIIENPVIREQSSGNIVMDKFNQAKLKRGQREIRFEQEPFPLYPGEVIIGEISPLQVILNGEAFIIEALYDFEGEDEVQRKSGDRYLFMGPATYIPRIEEKVIEKRKSNILKPHQALKLRALNGFTDRPFNVQRKAGDEWLYTKPGPYILDAYELLVETIDPVVLDNKTAVMVRAIQKFDDNGTERKKGEMWLLTEEDTTLYIPPPMVVIDRVVPITVLSSRQFCVLFNPVNENGVSQIGEKKLIVGPTKFFTQPGESTGKIEEVRVLSPESGIQLAVNEDFEESFRDNITNSIKQIKRKAGTRYYVYGPREFIPALQVTEIKHIKAVLPIEPLDIYIFNPAYLILLFLSVIYFLKVLLFSF